jgi:hypothetical protein
MRMFSRNASAALLAVAAAQLASPLSAMAGEPSVFTVVIRNVATQQTLKFPDGMTSAAPIAPGIYAVMEDGAKLFLPGKPASGSGLEQLAEDGDAQALLSAIMRMNGVRAAGLFVPGQPFTIKAMPGDRLAFASMFVQSNDKFYAPDPQGVDLFDGVTPAAGDFTAKVMLWDGGTEKDEPPGAGPNQAPRQKAANTGLEESGVVRAADDGFIYPATADVIQFTVLPQDAANSFPELVTAK